MKSMKIMIRATNWVGDAIMALPALRAIRKRQPDATISIVARPYVAEIYREQQVCDELIAYDPSGEHRGWSGREKLIADLRARKFDVALLLQNAFDAAWLAWRAQIPQRIGYARDARSLLLTKAIPVPKPGEIPPHEKFYYLELLRRAGWLDQLPEEPHITLHVPDAARQRAMQILLEAGSRPHAVRIAVGAGASYGSAKCWPPDRFAKALNALLAQAGADADVVLFGTPGELPVSSAIAAESQRPPINLTGKTSIADLPALLSQCHLFLGNDSGAMHVAAAVGLPVVAVFGPTDPNGTAPVTPHLTIVQQKPYCSPCFLRRCPTDHRCMTAVTPAMVESALQSSLAEVSPT
ncbi:MAG TPA: lipopolysaccharide heptosyltransferase II [Candidatus Sulfotelmatobacter sp.]|jgi:heptosyltransferase-2|nr:lipopolysaccharide heptosyltransferase II [Candidatus Sulfotelmatobacter sp.]